MVWNSFPTPSVDSYVFYIFSKSSIKCFKNWTESRKWILGPFYVRICKILWVNLVPLHRKCWMPTAVRLTRYESTNQQSFMIYFPSFPDRFLLLQSLQWFEDQDLKLFRKETVRRWLLSLWPNGYFCRLVHSCFRVPGAQSVRHCSAASAESQASNGPTPTHCPREQFLCFTEGSHMPRKLQSSTQRASELCFYIWTFITNSVQKSP